MLGLTQKAVAAIFKVGKETVHNWEIGCTRPTIQLVPTLITFLGYDPEPQNPRSIGDHLKSRRRRLGWTHEQAAHSFGVDASTWLRWEGGATIMGHHHRRAIAGFVGLPELVVNLTMKQQWNSRHNKPTVG